MKMRGNYFCIKEIIGAFLWKIICAIILRFENFAQLSFEIN